MSDAAAPPRRRSLPAATRLRLAASAYDLFDRQGFEATTLADVALDAELAPEVVLDRYPSTSALVWDGHDRALRVLSGELDAVPDGVPWRSALVEVVLAAQHHPGEDLHLLRRRLLLVHDVPLLLTQAHTRSATAEAAIGAFVARRTGTDPDGVVAFTLGRAVWAANQAGLLWWARSSEPDPRPVVRASLAEIGFSSP